MPRDRDANSQLARSSAFFFPVGRTRSYQRPWSCQTFSLISANLFSELQWNISLGLLGSRRAKLMWGSWCEETREVARLSIDYEIQLNARPLVLRCCFDLGRYFRLARHSMLHIFSGGRFRQVSHTEEGDNSTCLLLFMCVLTPVYQPPMGSASDTFGLICCAKIGPWTTDAECKHAQEGISLLAALSSIKRQYEYRYPFRQWKVVRMPYLGAVDLSHAFLQQSVCSVQRNAKHTRAARPEYFLNVDAKWLWVVTHTRACPQPFNCLSRLYQFALIKRVCHFSRSQPKSLRNRNLTRLRMKFLVGMSELRRDVTHGQMANAWSRQQPPPTSKRLPLGERKKALRGRRKQSIEWFTKRWWWENQVCDYSFVYRAIGMQNIVKTIAMEVMDIYLFASQPRLEIRNHSLYVHQAIKDSVHLSAEQTLFVKRKIWEGKRHSDEFKSTALLRSLISVRKMPFSLQHPKEFISFCYQWVHIFEQLRVLVCSYVSLETKKQKENKEKCWEKRRSLFIARHQLKKVFTI